MHLTDVVQFEQGEKETVVNLIRDNLDEYLCGNRKILNPTPLEGTADDVFFYHPASKFSQEKTDIFKTFLHELLALHQQIKPEIFKVLCYTCCGNGKGELFNLEVYFLGEKEPFYQKSF